MPIYNKFGPEDLLHYTLSTSPQIIANSGSSGWRSNTGTSGSISIYGGIRGRTAGATNEFNIKYIHKLETYSIDGTLHVSSSYPQTGTLSYAKCRNVQLNLLSDVHAGNWGKEHFEPIMNLYDYYSRTNAEYTTGSYDYYMLYSQYNSQNKVTISGSHLNRMTSSFAIEAMIKPFSTITSGSDYVIASRTNLWKFYITGSTGKLAFSASDGSGLIRTSSVALTENRWQHVAFTYANFTSSFFLNVNNVGNNLVSCSFGTSAVDAVNVFFSQNDGAATSFHGCIFDVKLWSTTRTYSQLSSSFDRTLVNSGSSNLIGYYRFNDGPRVTTHGYTRGSGAFDYSPTAAHGLLQNFNTRTTPIWHPNDNHTFITYKKLIPNTIDELMVVNIPSLYYGKQIATGSVLLECNSYLSSSIHRYIKDDGRGGLYISGSICSSSLATQETYDGVKWNKVGNVFYSEGLMVLKDPSILDFGSNNSTSQKQTELFNVTFKGINNIPTNVFMCRANVAEANASNNPTFSTFNSGTGNFDIIREDNTTYITAVGLYDKYRNLVAVAKLASPVRKREKDKITIRLHFDR